MSNNSHVISLGFTGENFPPGVHICQIFSDDDERQAALLRFILSGVRAGESTRCFSDNLTAEAVEEYLSGFGISFQQAAQDGALGMAGTDEVYFKNDTFDPERMLGLLRTFHTQSMAQGFSAARVIGEMTPKVQHVPGGSRLLEYEARVSLLLKEYPVTAVCQYDARRFDGATIMDVLRVHPLMVVRGEVVHNPFFVAPEEFVHNTPHQ